MTEKSTQSSLTLPDRVGSGDIQSFAANHSPGTLAAVQSFTNPELARILVGKLHKPGGGDKHS